MKALVLMLALSGCFLFGERDPLVRGRIAIKEQRFGDAERELASVPPTHPGFQEARFLLGTLALVTASEPVALAQIVAARALAADRFDENHEWRRILAALSGKLATQWTVKVAQTPSSIASAGAMRFAISNRGMLTAFEPKRGVVWEHALGTRGGSARARVAIAEGRVLAVEHDHSRAKLIALDIQTGQPAWSADLGRADSQQNPIVSAGTVFVGVAADGQRGGWRAFRADSGAPLWSAPLDHPPGASAIAGDKLCALVETSVVCVELASGATAWRYDGLDRAPSGMAIVAADSHVYVTSNGTLYAFAIGRPGLAWKQRVAPATMSAPTLSDGALVLETADAIVAYDAETGAKQWIAHHHGVSPAALDGRPLVRLDGLWLGWTHDGVFAIDDNHALVFDAEVGGISAPPIAVAPNEIIVGVAGKVEGVVALAVEPWGTKR